MMPGSTTVVEAFDVEHAVFEARSRGEPKLNDSVALLAGLEYLQAFTDTNASRLNADASVKANLSKKFALATSVQMRFDNAPLPGKTNTDVLTSVSLVYSMF